MKSKGRLPHGGRGLKLWLKSYLGPGGGKSSPARGTWVEIAILTAWPCRHARRLPHGGRGLKLNALADGMFSDMSSPARGTWVEIPGAIPGNIGPGVVSRTGDVG